MRREEDEPRARGCERRGTSEERKHRDRRDECNVTNLAAYGLSLGHPSPRSAYTRLIPFLHSSRRSPTGRVRVARRMTEGKTPRGADRDTKGQSDKRRRMRRSEEQPRRTETQPSERGGNERINL